MCLRNGVLALVTIVAMVAPGRAGLFSQASTSEPTVVNGMTVSGSLRTRIESWDWFGGNPNGDYAYSGSLFRLGLGQAKTARDWQFELAIPVLLGLPAQAAGAGPQGLGANYFSANHGHTNAAMVFVKQAFLRFNRLGGVEGQSLKLGRMELFDGAEVSPKNATLATIKRDRIAQRLLGSFGFTHVGRSLDGALYTMDKSRLNVTIVAARPTRGVFQVDGWGELNVSVFYAALTGQLGDTTSAGEWRLFGLRYRDRRHNVVTSDNRTLAARQADGSPVATGTFGGHYIRAVGTPSGAIDLLVWGALQTGSWGQLAHRAGAFAAEAGWQPKVLQALAPWIRGGFDYGSGDADPSDTTHATFFQVLTTPRQYARFPFFNMMNSADWFGELSLSPSRRFKVRADVHALRLANANDLWYQGGGAFQPGTFGFVGLPSSGHRGLATLYDVSADLAVTPRLSVGGYYGYAAGGLVPKSIYAVPTDAALGYIELMFRF